MILAAERARTGSMRGMPLEQARSLSMDYWSETGERLQFARG
jgi:hypothetical protein